MDKIHFSNDAKRIKYEVLKHVAQLAFSGELEERKDAIPFEIIPGVSPSFRCCVYKEREIIRGRVRLAMGQSSEPGRETNNVVDVITAACEGCPINRFRVTENCQKCMAKNCVSACPFNAITITGRGAYIDQDKCRECGRCASVCPYNAIADLMRPCKRSCPVDAITMDKNKIAVIQEDKCIRCGACTTQCPFGAISDVSYMVNVIEELISNCELYAIPAPAIEGQFGEHASFGVLRAALLDLGFTDVLEVALGADAVASHEAEELLENFKISKKMTTSCCPAFVNMIEKQFPNLIPNMSDTVSPMLAASRYIKANHKGAKVVFIGPCIAKKDEAKRPLEGNVDYVLTYEEIAAMFEVRQINLESYDEAAQDGSLFGKQFAQQGGVTAAVLRVLEERDTIPSLAAKKCNGAAECKKTLTLLKAGKLPEDFVEGMACEGGCVCGPATVAQPNVARVNRDKIIKRAEQINIGENLEKHDFSHVNMVRN